MQKILNNNLWQHTFRLPLFIMGVAAGLLSLRGEDYSKSNSGILHHLSPWTCSKPVGSSNNEENPNVWSNKTDRCSLVLIFLIVYSVVVSKFYLTVRLNISHNINLSVFFRIYTGFLVSTSTLNCFAAISSWLWSWASQKMRENLPLEDFAGANLSSFLGIIQWLPTCYMTVC